mmetsp:Transcript_674/g.1616  ORF Transcript_674/g.1616 Transcript_674/m.1616 type:complete len:190 (+) Transcript_674:82-651(+)
MALRLLHEELNRALAKLESGGDAARFGSSADLDGLAKDADCPVQMVSQGISTATPSSIQEPLTPTPSMCSQSVGESCAGSSRGATAATTPFATPRQSMRLGAAEESFAFGEACLSPCGDALVVAPIDERVRQGRRLRGARDANLAIGHTSPDRASGTKWPVLTACLQRIDESGDVPRMTDGAGPGEPHS